MAGASTATRKPSTADRDFLRVVAEDLRHLHEVWSPGEISLENLRRDSVILRRLLGPDRALQGAWFATEGETEFVVPTWKLEDVLDGVPKARLRLASIGGAQFHEAQLGPMFGFAGSSAHGGPRPDELQTHSLSLKAFSNGHCMLIDGQFVTRLDLVEYFANKLGGAHIDKKRDAKAYAALEKVPRYTSTRGDIRDSLTKGGLPLFTLEVTHDDSNYEIDPLHAEILSIGQWLGKSPCSITLSETILKSPGIDRPG